MIPLFKQKFSSQNHRHEMHISKLIYLLPDQYNSIIWICTNRSSNDLQGSINSQTLRIIIFIYLFSWYKFWALQILPPLTEISSSRLVRKRIQKDWFVIQLLVYNRFKKSRVSFFIVNSGWLGGHRYPASYYVRDKLDRLRQERLWQGKVFMWNV
jgi:hypothetical protein